jgi:signal transduction histidine kinase/Tfp pilus assembly protein FimT
MKTWINRFSLSRLSIQQRLPLLICALLLTTITIYGLANYYSLKKGVLAIGSERLSSLTDQLSSMLGQSTGTLINSGNAVATQNTVIACLKSNGKEFRKETLEALDKLHRDSNWVAVTLVNADFLPVLRADNSKGEVEINLKDVIKYSPVGPNSTIVGRMFAVNGTMYYPIITSVSENKQIIGYIIELIHLNATRQAVTQLSKLVGTGAGFYLTNTDQSFWTDMVKPVAKPPINASQMGKVMEYTNTDGKRMMASAKSIAGSDWLVMVEFPEDIVLSGVRTFLRWILVIGLVLTATGIFAAWVMSRKITKPLNRLTAAATAISGGDYSASVPVNGQQSDELGKLANAFNIMAGQVNQMHLDMENKVIERTVQLENVNKELEAFSYSVSHDLRTPLRAISGYSIMLKEDYESELDAEGKRIIRNIISNAKMMGQLIDDLLSFSRLGKKELVRTPIDMQSLAETVVKELLQNGPENKYSIQIGLLAPINADQVMIRQVLINIIGNAIKYSSKKIAPEIEIGFNDETANIVYYVKDNGAGFDMAYANKLFGVFQRLHSQEEFEGTGVGLALVKRIIDKHKGTAWAEALENVGATFYFSLPKN